MASGAPGHGEALGPKLGTCVGEGWLSMNPIETSRDLHWVCMGAVWVLDQGLQGTARDCMASAWGSYGLYEKIYGTNV